MRPSSLLLLLLASPGCEDRTHKPPGPLHPATAQAPDHASPLPSHGPAADLRALAPQASPPRPALKGTANCPNSKSCRHWRDCLAIPEALSVTCTSSHCCQITQCIGGWFDVNGLADDGCECSDSRYAHTCGGATELGTVQTGQSLSPIIGDLPLPNEENWFQVTFGGNGKPAISLASKNPQIVFDVCRGDCRGPVYPCGNEGTTAANVTTWDSCERPDMQPHNDSTAPATQIVRVYRNGGAPTCDFYTLTISNN